jgi:GNAT superfamily N-acetyltransferase
VTGRLPLRPVTDADAAGVIALVGGAYAEHPGCVLDLPGVDDDLPAPATAAARRGGRWWVVVDGDGVVASVGTGPVTAAGTLELKRLYVAATHRRRGLASRLVRRVEAHAVGLGASGIELWSDTRFTDAHLLYARHGYLDTGDRRQLHDPSDTTEVRFHRDLDPTEPDRLVCWSGPFGREHCAFVALPDGAVLRGHVQQVGLDYEVEVDAAWRTRRVSVTEPGSRRELTSDGAGRWWRGGQEDGALAGCTDVDIEATPATNTLPVRRARAADARDQAVRAAWLRVPGPAVDPTPQHYERLGRDRWRYTSGTFRAELTTDEDGLVVDYEGLWRRVPPDP